MGLVGGASYFDAATDDIRLTLATVMSARDAGAVVAQPRVGARSAHDERRRLRRARGGSAHGRRHRDSRARGRERGRARGATRIRRMAEPQARRAVRGTKGVHVSVPRDRIRNNGALTLLSPIDGRVMFVLPAGRVQHHRHDRHRVRRPPRARARHQRRRDLSPPLGQRILSRRASHCRATSSPRGRGSVRSSRPETRIRMRRRASTRSSWTVPGLLSVTGGKLTTYRSMAVDVMDTIARRLRVGHRRAATHKEAAPRRRHRVARG